MFWSAGVLGGGRSSTLASPRNGVLDLASCAATFCALKGLQKSSTIPLLLVDGWPCGGFDTVVFVGEKRVKSRDSSCLARPVCGKGV
jgi:hypothetical protein